LDRPVWRYLLPELLEDLNSGHNIVATVTLQPRLHRGATVRRYEAGRLEPIHITGRRGY